MSAVQDKDLHEWLMGIVHGHPSQSGGFLRSLADASLRADDANYLILRPALLKIQAKYPNYKFDEKRGV
jgi:hypothetical protein